VSARRANLKGRIGVEWGRLEAVAGHKFGGQEVERSVDCVATLIAVAEEHATAGKWG
jgi:hypothetical protein